MNEYSSLDCELRRAEELWNVVYSCLSSAYADIDAGRENNIETDEITIMRETTYEIVQAALIALKGT